MSASEDAPPRLKIFLSPIDSYLGRALFRFFKSQKHDIYASCLYGEDDPRYFRPNYVRSFVSLENREELKATLLQCDVIIYDIAQKYEEANFAIEEVSTIRLHDEKTFIALSSILTWARTEKNEPEEGEEGETLPAPPFTEEDRRKRRPHPTYRNVLQLERLILRRARRRLRTLVLTLGVLYGDGEEPFHDWFKMAWHGEPAALPLYGDGENHVPTIHVRDVCTIVGHVIEQPPEETILLCVDEGNATQRQIAEAIANKMGTGRVEPVSEEQLMLTSRDLAYLIEDVPMESAVLREMELEWHCQGGLIEHLDKVVEEYKQDRGLTALKILVHGPPASGKTTLSQALAQHFKLAHVNLDATIEEYRNMPAPERPQRSGEEEEEEEEAGDPDPSVQELVREALERDPVLPDAMIVKMLRDKLNSRVCRCQGFVLDGFPRNLQDCQALFGAAAGEAEEEAEEEEGEPGAQPSVDPQTFTDVVIKLDAPNGFLVARAMGLAQDQAEAAASTEEAFMARVTRFREQNTIDNDLSTFFAKLERDPLYFDVAETPQDNLAEHLLAESIGFIGAPHNYGPTAEEIEAERARIAREEAECLAAAERELKAREEAEAAERAKRAAIESARLAEIQRQESAILAERSKPLRRYLMENVMPTLTQALLEISKVRPEDPIDYLAEYLFHNNPDEDTESQPYEQ